MNIFPGRMPVPDNSLEKLTLHSSAVFGSKEAKSGVGVLVGNGVGVIVGVLAGIIVTPTGCGAQAVTKAIRIDTTNTWLTALGLKK